MTKEDGLRIAPAVRISGAASVPGDKSISHRLAMLGAVAEGTTTIHNFAESADCQSTLDCLSDLGAAIKRTGSTVSIEGRGLRASRSARRAECRKFRNNRPFDVWPYGRIFVRVHVCRR
jgi:3-phosphoshikimate 1-carboxyvinyltransferase